MIPSNKDLLYQVAVPSRNNRNIFLPNNIMIRLSHQDLIDGDAIAISFCPSNAQAKLRALRIFAK
jgi:hypothetical protein